MRDALLRFGEFAGASGAAGGLVEAVDVISSDDASFFLKVGRAIADGPGWGAVSIP